MAEVRDFNSYLHRRRAAGAQKQTQQQPSPAQEKIRERVRTHRLLVLLRTCLLIGIAVGACIFLYHQWRDKIYQEARITGSARLLDAEDASMTALDGQILQYSKDGVSLRNAAGEVLWNQTYQMQNPIVRTCRNVAAVGDYNGHVIYVMNTDGPMGEIDTNLPIRSFSVAAQGVVAAVLDGTDITWIYLYDAQGNELANFKTTMQDSGYPLSVAVSPNGQLVCVSYLHEENADLMDSVAFYNFGSVGQNEIDNYASGYDYPGAVVPLVQFLNEKSAFAVSNDRIMFYAGDQVPVSRTENLFGEEEILSVYWNEEYAGIIFANSTEEGAYRLQVYDTDGELVMTKCFDLAYSDLIFGDRQIILYNDAEWQIINMNGTEKFHGVFEQGVRRVIPTSARSRFLLVTADEIQTVELK